MHAHTHTHVFTTRFVVSVPLSGGFSVHYCYLLTVRFRGAQIFQINQARTILSTQKYLNATIQNLVSGAILCPGFWHPCIILRRL